MLHQARRYSTRGANTRARAQSCRGLNCVAGLCDKALANARDGIMQHANKCSTQSAEAVTPFVSKACLLARRLMSSASLSRHEECIGDWELEMTCVSKACLLARRLMSTRAPLPRHAEGGDVLGRDVLPQT
jgi:hypothetical protein